MFQRVLWVSLTQTLRSVALVLLPCAFISLLIWATAGSSNGDTTDPMRAALWLWLASHHIPFDLVLPPGGEPGLFSFLPLGAIIFPLLAIRSGFNRGFDLCDRDPRTLRLLRILFCLFYPGIAALISWGSISDPVKPITYFVPINTLVLILIASLGIDSKRRKKDFSPVRIAVRILAVALGASSIALGISLTIHLKTVENLTLVLQPGLLGGVALFVLSTLYIPNAILATLSYLAGPGFAVGTNTLISPLTHDISQIPALPLLGGLPTGPHPLGLLGVLGLVGCGIALYRSTLWHSRIAIGQAFLAALCTIALLAFLSSGSLLTSSLATVGVSPWQLTLAFGAELGLGVLLAWLVPLSMEALRNRVGRK